MNIYLAGTGVFKVDAVEHGRWLKNLCAIYGHDGHYPMDNEIDGSDSKAIAEAIKEANVKMIRECDCVIADLNSFRGTEPDSGTVWEVGFAQGLGKPVFGFCESTDSYLDKTRKILGLHPNALYDANGFQIESFGLTHNLMFADCIVSNSFEGCLIHINQLGEKMPKVKDVLFQIQMDENGATVLPIQCSDVLTMGDIASVFMSCAKMMKGKVSSAQLNQFIAEAWADDEEPIEEDDFTPIPEIESVKETAVLTEPEPSVKS
jgi:nucleoside 2-deoxyribosyltransferase